MGSGGEARRGKLRVTFRNVNLVMSMRSRRHANENIK